MAKKIHLTIDGVAIEADEGELIVDAAKKIDIDIPVFCYHPKMEPVGMCRMCLVEIGRPAKDRATGEWVKNEDGTLKISFGPKLETACTTPVSEGMVVVTNSAKAKAGRKDILEFLLTSHPLDCPICDKGGECPLQNLTMAHGPGQSRFIWDEKMRLGKHVPLGELIILDRERCIQCGRCIRFQTEIVDDPVIGFYQRGRNLEIITFSDPGFDSIYSGNTTDICPVGALLPVDFRFEARPWEMAYAPSICNHCPVGCNLTLNVRREARAGGDTVIKRALPRQNERVNEIWICDKGRFAYHYAQAEDRLTTPLVRKDGKLVPVTLQEALQAAGDCLRLAGKDMLALAGGRLSNEDLFNISELASGTGGKAALYTSMAGGDLTGLGPGSNIGEMGPGTAILVVACDLKEEAPIWWLRVKQAAERGATLMVANPRPTSLDKHAAHVLRYAYGYETSTVRALAEGGGTDPSLPETQIAKIAAETENLVILYGSEGLGLEASQELAQACAALLAKTNHTGKPNNGLLAAWDAGNGQGAWDMGLRPDANLPDAIRAAKGVYIAGADPAGESPELAQALKDGGFVVVQDLFLTETAQLADVVLPAQSFAEREGSYTNGERRVQRYYPAIQPRPGCLPDFALTALVAQQLGQSLEGNLPSRVMERIAASRPHYANVTYQKLAEVVDQWPIVGRGDLYYGGTSYENRQGLGVQLAQPGLPPAPTQPVSSPKPAERPAGELLAVPITRLYDLANTMVRSLLIKRRIPVPYVALNPEDATRLGLEDIKPAEVLLEGKAYPVQVHIHSEVPPGIVLAPRKLGLTLQKPVEVEIRKSETTPEAPATAPTGAASAAGQAAIEAGRGANTGTPGDQTEAKQ